MRRGVSIFLLILLVATQTPMGQVFKFPNLIEHFFKHKKQNGVSLLDFLKDHYKANHNDADLPEDQQLPFKDITFQSIVIAIVPDTIKTAAVTSTPLEEKTSAIDFYTPQQHLGSIFHPPRT